MVAALKITLAVIFLLIVPALKGLTEMTLLP